MSELTVNFINAEVLRVAADEHLVIKVNLDQFPQDVGMQIVESLVGSLRDIGLHKRVVVLIGGDDFTLTAVKTEGASDGEPA